LLKRRIDEIVAHRTAALAGFKAVHDALAAAKAHAQAAARWFGIGATR
jgi:hypothetical protein